MCPGRVRHFLRKLHLVAIEDRATLARQVDEQGVVGDLDELPEDDVPEVERRTLAIGALWPLAVLARPRPRLATLVLFGNVHARAGSDVRRLRLVRRLRVGRDALGRSRAGILGQGRSVARRADRRLTVDARCASRASALSATTPAFRRTRALARTRLRSRSRRSMGWLRRRLRPSLRLRARRAWTRTARRTAFPAVTLRRPWTRARELFVARCRSVTVVVIVRRRRRGAVSRLRAIVAWLLTTRRRIRGSAFLWRVTSGGGLVFGLVRRSAVRGRNERRRALLGRRLRSFGGGHFETQVSRNGAPTIAERRVIAFTTSR